jgi:hypothetical protein
MIEPALLAQLIKFRRERVGTISQAERYCRITFN